MDLGGAPQGFAAAIRVTRALISALTGGRPPVGRPESVVQCSRKRGRCHRRTVSGVTITRGCLQPAQTRASHTQKSPIKRVKPGPGHLSPVYGELVAQGEVLECELAMAAAEEWEESKQAGQEGDHRVRIFSGSEPTDQPLGRRAGF